MKNKIIVLCISLAMTLLACGKGSDAGNAANTNSGNEASVEAEEQNDASVEEESQNKDSVSDSADESLEDDESVEVVDEKLFSRQLGKAITKVTFTKPEHGAAKISFEFVDDSVQEFETAIMHLGCIKSIELLDIDNDNEDEYVIQYYFSNTGGEYNFTQVFKYDGRDVIDISPYTNIPELEDYALHSKIIEKEIDGIEQNAIRVRGVGSGKNFGKVYNGILYCKDGKWTATAIPDDGDDLW